MQYIRYYYNKILSGRLWNWLKDAFRVAAAAGLFSRLNTHIPIISRHIFYANDTVLYLKFLRYLGTGTAAASWLRWDR